MAEGQQELGFDGMKEIEKTPPEKMIDPVVPLASPVTKTYGRNVTHTEHEQKMDVAFDLLVSTPGERELDGTDELASGKSTTGKKQKLGSVKFLNLSSRESGSGSAASTPHPRSRKSKATFRLDENSDPNLPVSSPGRQPVRDKQDSNSRVSLLPGMDYSPENVVLKLPTDDLMSFSPMPTRRSSRISSAQ